jgi:hypothetical protein
VPRQRQVAHATLYSANLREITLNEKDLQLKKTNRGAEHSPCHVASVTSPAVASVAYLHRRALNVEKVASVTSPSAIFLRTSCDNMDTLHQSLS